MEETPSPQLSPELREEKRPLMYSNSDSRPLAASLRGGPRLHVELLHVSMGKELLY
jgi:hypothetical protein